MKVLIANPPWENDIGYGCRSNTRWPHIRKDKYLIFPIYIAYAAAVLEKEGIEVSVIDAVAEEYDSEAFKEAVKNEKPDLCFIETSTPTIYQDINNASNIKGLDDIEVYLFGTHATIYHMEILGKYDFIDGVLRREFEYTIRDMGKGRPLQEVEGLSYRDNGEIKINKDRPPIMNLDELPFPAWHLFNMEYYESHLYKSPSAWVITSRGCPFQCTYCMWPDIMYGHKQRYRSAENICDEMETLIKQFGVREIRLDDDTFALNPKHVINLCNEIERRGINRKIGWTCFGHASQSNEEIYKRLSETGCFKIDFGIESGSPKVLKDIKKSLDPDKARNTVKICKKYGLEVYCDFMIGFPHETEDDINMSIDLAKSLDCDYIQVSYVIPYPGTRMYADGVKEGFLKYPYDWEKYAACEPMISSGNIDIEKLQKIYRKFWISFYLRPKLIFRKFIKAMSSFDEFKRISGGFISFMKRFIL